MNTINVLHILNSTSGGSALSTFELIDELKKFDVKSSLICFKNGSSDLQNEITDKVDGRVLFRPLYWMNKKIRAKWWKRPAIEALSIWQTWFGYRYQKKFRGFAQKHQINIIHTSTILNPEGAILSSDLGIPHIWHCRELVGPGMPFQFPFFKHWIQCVDNHTNSIIANSELTNTELLRYFSSQKVNNINNGLDVALFRTKIHSAKLPIIVGMIGNVTSRLKNHSMYIEVATAFQQQKLAVEFHIFGALPDKEDKYFKKLQNSVNNNSLVKFRGHVDTQLALDEMDIMFHPAYTESFGRVIIEAMAAGIPVIGLTEGGQNTIIEDTKTGFLFNKEDISGIRDKILELGQNHALRTSVGKLGRQAVEKRYNLENNIGELIGIYKTNLS